MHIDKESEPGAWARELEQRPYNITVITYEMPEIPPMPSKDDEIADLRKKLASAQKSCLQALSTIGQLQDFQHLADCFLDISFCSSGRPIARGYACPHCGSYDPPNCKELEIIR